MKKTLAILLSLALVICMIPGTAFAATELSTAEVAVEAGPHVYTGEAITPAVTVAGAAITAEQYSVDYSNNINVGKATVTVTATAENITYTGSKSVEFDITAASIEDAVVTVAEGTYTYNGKEHTPEVTVTLNGETLVKDTDYTVSYTDNKEGGTATAKATVTGKGNYTGTQEGTFTISAFDLSKVTVSVGSQISTIADGKNPEKFNWNNVDFYIDGVLNNAFLNETNLDVTVSTASNGTKTATFEGKDAENIDKTIAGTFVTKADINASVAATVTGTYTYDGKEKVVSVSFTKNSGYTGALPSSTDYEIVYVGGRTAAGSHTVTINGKNNFAGTITGVAYTIGKRDASNVSIEAIPNQIAGTKPLPVVTDTINGQKVTLALNTDYVVEHSEVNGVGTVTVNFDAKTAGNYKGTKSTTYSVVAADKIIKSEHITVVPYNQYYANVVQTPALSVNMGGATNDLRKGTDYTVTYKYTDAKGVVQTTSSPKDAHDYTIVVTGKGTYGGEVEITGKFTIAKFPFTSNYVTITVTQGSTTATPNVTVKSIDGRITFVKGTDYTVGTPYTYNGKSTVTITSTNTGNLGAGSLSETYAVSAKNIAYCTADFVIGSKQTYQYTGSIIKPNVTVRDGYTTLVAGTDYTVTYKDAAGKVVYSPKDAGTYQIVIEGKGMYSGTKTLTFYIQGTSIANYTVTLKESVVNATGYAQTPTIVSVKYGANSSLTSSDYTVSYQNAAGTTVTSIKTPGTYKVVVTGKNGYSGSTYATFTVKGLDQTMKIAKTSYKVYEDSDSFKINASVTGDGTIIYTSMNPSVATVSSTGVVTIHKVGRARIVVETINNVKYDPVEDDVYVNVYPDKAKITKKPWTDGKASQLKVRWGYQDGVTKYQVRYSRDKNFSSGSYLTKTVKAHGKAYTTQSTTLSNLKRGYTYYVKVRAVYTDPVTGDNYYGSWSGWRSAKTI